MLPADGLPGQRIRGLAEPPLRDPQAWLATKHRRSVYNGSPRSATTVQTTANKEQSLRG